MKHEVLGLLAVGLLAGPLAAQAVTIDFDGVPDGGIPCFGGTCNLTYLSIDYLEDGFHLTTGLGSWDSSNSNFDGSKSLHISAFAGVTTLTRVGGGAFTLNSIDLSEVWQFLDDISSECCATISFIGTRADSSTVTAEFTPDGVFGNETFALSGFTDLVSVSWNQGEEGLLGHQFDNIDSAPIPEPGALALLGLGLAGLGFTRPRRAH